MEPMPNGVFATRIATEAEHALDAVALCHKGTIFEFGCMPIPRGIKGYKSKSI